MNELLMEQFDGKQAVLVSVDTYNKLHIIPQMIAALRDITEIDTTLYSDEFTTSADYAESSTNHVSEHGYEKLEILYDLLYDALDDNAPAGYYFGSDTNGGAALGFWPIDSGEVEITTPISTSPLYDEIKASGRYEISNGTLHPRDLLPVELDYLKALSPTYANGLETIEWFDTQMESYVKGELSTFAEMELEEALIDALEKLSPEGYYFGSHPCDGACIGFWPVDNDLFTTEGEYYDA